MHPSITITANLEAICLLHTKRLVDDYLTQPFAVGAKKKNAKNEGKRLNWCLNFSMVWSAVFPGNFRKLELAGSLSSKSDNKLAENEVYSFRLDTAVYCGKQESNSCAYATCLNLFHIIQTKNFGRLKKCVVSFV